MTIRTSAVQPRIGARAAKLAALAAMATLTLAACGSDPVATTGEPGSGTSNGGASGLACPGRHAVG